MSEPEGADTGFARCMEEKLGIGYPVLGLVHQIARLRQGDAGKRRT